MYEIETHRLLNRLQTIYWDLIKISPVERTTYYQSRIAAITCAHQRVSQDIENCQLILDEFAPELRITQNALTHIVNGR
ncbi:hypothetical protein GCM10028805_45770 [Spirosoma harenae]